MRRWLPTAALLLALARPVAGAEPVARTVTFHSVPPGARVYLHAGPRDLKQGALLGITGGPLVLVLDPRVTELNVTYDLPGHRPRHELLNLPPGELPADFPPVVLEPDSTAVLLADLAAAHRTLVLALLAGIGLAGGIYARRRGTVREAEERGRTLNRIEVRAAGDRYVGKRVGDLRLVARIGGGGMARVYRGVPEQTLDVREAVAVKLIRSERMGDADFMARFRREINTLRTLSHPNVVRLIDWGEQEGLLYLVMELIEGATLRERVRPGGLTPAEALPLLRGVARGLIYAHGQGVVHRDLKPENVMVTDRGAVKVMDFGLARSAAAQTTRHGAAMGTPGYMAPEQIRGGDVDARADQYAFGLLAYELLAGRPPVEGGDALAIMHAHLAERPLPGVRQFRPDLPEALEAVLARSMARRAEERYPSVAALLEAIESTASSTEG